jgi:DNA-binding NarL/FixJ family response regulator
MAGYGNRESMITVSILEDDARTLGYLSTLLQGSEHISVIGAYTSGEEALEYIPQHLPDVFISDLNLPGISGIEVIRHVKAKFEKIDILVLTMHDEWSYIMPAFKAGATGYILKGTRPAEIIESILSIRNGGAPMSPMIARNLIKELRGAKPEKLAETLSEREKNILQGISTGLSEKTIAERENISYHTVHAHIKNIYKKLHVNSKTEALLKARSDGYL